MRLRSLHLTLGTALTFSIVLGLGSARAQGTCVLAGYVLEAGAAPASNSELRVRHVTTGAEVNCPVEHDAANTDINGRYVCPATPAGTYTARLFRSGMAVPNRDTQIVRCEPSRVDFAFRADMHADRRDAGRAHPERAYACIVSGRVTTGGNAIADGTDSVVCSIGERDPKYESIGDTASVTSPIVGGRYQCRVSPGQVLLTLESRQGAEAEKIPCANRCAPLPEPADGNTAVQPVEHTCDADFPTFAINLPVEPNCTLTGTVRKNGAVPPPSEQIKCTPNGAWSPINDTTGSYSCGSLQGTVSLTLSSGYGGTKTCTCSDTTTVCNPSF